MDLRWEYNNVKIKKENKQKAAFTTSEGSFKPTFMFFGLINSLATFQAIINKLLRDLINMEKVRSFINDIMVETETEKKHDELIAKILRRLGENNLYMKPEKCKWKMSKIDFLEVVLRLEDIKMKEVKIKVVLNSYSLNW